MRIVVTGAGGFLGGRFCAAASAAGHQVVACARRESAALAAIATRVVVKDILSLSAQDIGGAADAVVNFATGTDGAPERVLRVAAEGARNAYALSAACGAKRFVHISSVSVYGKPSHRERRQGGGVGLDRHPERRGLYAQSKIMAEAAIQDITRRAKPAGMEVCILRPGLVFGPGMKDVLAGTGLPTVLDIVVGLGDRRHGVPILHVKDLCAGLLALLEADPCPGASRVWDVLSGEPPDKQRFLRQYARLTGHGHRCFWVPRTAAFAVGVLLEAAFLLLRRPRHILYKLARLYDFSPATLDHREFWQHVGIRPAADARSCILAGVGVQAQAGAGRCGPPPQTGGLGRNFLRVAACGGVRVDKAVDLILVGAGRIVWEMHLPSLKMLPQYRVTAVVDPDQALASKLAAEFPGALALRSLEDIRGDKFDGSTAVIATPGFTHATIAARLLQLNVALLIEKPPALTMAEFTALASAARGVSGVVTVFQNYRLRPNVLEFWRFLAEHDVGSAVNVQLVFHSGQILHEQARWSRDEKRNRVLLMELAEHFFDLVCLVAGPLTAFEHVSMADSEPDGNTLAVRALGRSELGAQVYIDLDASGIAQGTEILFAFERCTCVLNFFPEGFRVLPRRRNPVDDIAASCQQLAGFLRRRVLRDASGVPRRALPHFWIYRSHLRALAGEGSSAFSLDTVDGTIRSLDSLSKWVYPGEGGGARHAGAASLRHRADV